MKLTIVYFCNGEYEDFTKTIYGIFSKQKLAKKYFNKQNAILNKFGLNRKGNNSNAYNYDILSSDEIVNKFGFVCSGGCWYEMEEDNFYLDQGKNDK